MRSDAAKQNGNTDRSTCSATRRKRAQQTTAWPTHALFYKHSARPLSTQDRHKNSAPRARALLNGCSDALQGECDALPATDAQRDHPTANVITRHRVQQPCGKNRTGRTDGMAVSDGTAVYIDDLLG